MALRVVLGHGASGTAASMAPFVDGLRARGIDAVAVDLPQRKAEDVVPRWLELAPPGPGIVAGGHSFGGRVASLAAAAAGGDGRLPRARVLLLPAPSARRAPSWGRESRTGPRSPARSCCCRANPTRSRGSTSCGPRSRCSVTASSSRTPGSVTA